MTFILKAVVILFIFAFVVYVLKMIARLSLHVRKTAKELTKMRGNPLQETLFDTLSAPQILDVSAETSDNMNVVVLNKKTATEKKKEIIENKKRGDAGMSVPGHALFLIDVTYPFIF